MPEPKKNSSSKCNFVHPQEDSSTLLDRLDFSQAFKSTNLSTALCFTNPMHQKFLEKTVESTQRQKQRRQLALYHNQRTFFINQVFEKGLNPYIRASKDKIAHSKSAIKQDSSRSAGASSSRMHYGSFDPVQRPHTETAHPYDRDTPQSILRQKTFPEMSSSKKSVQIVDRDNSIKGNDYKTRKSLPNISDNRNELTVISQYDHARSSTKLPKLSEVKEPVNNTMENDDDNCSEFSHACTPDIPNPKEKEEESKSEELSLSLSAPTRSQRRDITFLKRNPGMLFPKMNELLLRDLLGDNEPFSIENEKAREAKIQSEQSGKASNKRESLVEGNNSNKEKKEVDDRRRKEENNSLDYVKLIQKLTTYIPDHLAETAKDQIREMTQTEEIYEQKERLLEKNRGNLHRSKSLGDRRWSKLEGSLSATHGVNAKWKKVRPTGAWIKIDV